MKKREEEKRESDLDTVGAEFVESTLGGLLWRGINVPKGKLLADLVVPLDQETPQLGLVLLPLLVLVKAGQGGIESLVVVIPPQIDW